MKSKKVVLSLLIVILCIFMIYAQKFEVISEFKFNNKISYYEDWIDDDGYHAPGISELFVIDKIIYAYNYSQSEWFSCYKNNYKKMTIQNCGYNYLNNKVLIRKNKNISIDVYLDADLSKEPDYILKLEPNTFFKNSQSVYYSNDMIFVHNNKNELICWKLLGNGNTEYLNVEKTKNIELELMDNYGFHKNSNNFFFGETRITSAGFPYIEKNSKKLSFVTEKYSFYNSMSAFTYIGTDKRGFSYYYKFKTHDNIDPLTTKEPITVLIAVVDPWTKEVNVIELPEGDWNPSRNEKGLIAMCAQCVDKDGNIYFTDCNKDKGCYQIKKLNNDWINKYDFSKRIIGIVNTNNIPLRKEPNGNPIDSVKNYENEYLWILDQNNGWAKVQKVSGAIGWIETNYFDK